MGKILTVFTPTYNRQKELARLYEALVSQTNQQFEWLIVDDGSTDNTTASVRTWQADGLINISYVKQANRGKSMAHNRGVELTETPLFVCVDSDDFLVADAVALIIEQWQKHQEDVIGFLFFKEDTSGNPITQGGESIAHATLDDMYRQHGMRGDAILVYRTAIIKQVAFPDFPGEKFVPEAYLYDLLDEFGELAIIPIPILIGDYLPDGYSASMESLLLNNPQGYHAFITNRLKKDKQWCKRVLDTIRYTAFHLAKGTKGIIRTSVYPWLTAVLFPVSYAYYLYRFKRFT